MYSKDELNSKKKDELKEIAVSMNIGITPSMKKLDIINEILKNEPDNIDALNGKGSALMKLNRFDDAEKCFDKSLTISENTSALINKGIILKNKKDYQNAIYYFNKAIGMDCEMNTILSIFKNEIFKQIDINFCICLLNTFDRQILFAFFRAF